MEKKNQQSLKESNKKTDWYVAQKTIDTEIDDVTADQLLEELEYHFDHPESGRPLLIWGAPGIGKTSIVKNFGLKIKGVPVIEVILSLMEPTDVAGLPGKEPDLRSPDVKRSVNYLPMIWPLDNGPDDKGGIIFLDEINRAHPSVQAAMLKVVLDREIAAAGYKIPSKWLILAAANRPEDEPGSMIKPISFALADRFAQVNFMSDPDSWVKWAKGKNLNGEVVAFIELLQDYFYKMPKQLVGEDSESTMGVTPRSWEYAAKEYDDRSKGRKLDGESIRKIFAKHVGNSTALIITDFIMTNRAWPLERISLIYTDPTNPLIELPKNPSGGIDVKKAYAVVYMASKYKEGGKITKEEYSNLLTYLKGINYGEIAIPALNLAKGNHPEIKTYMGDTSLSGVLTPFVTQYRSFMKEV